MDGSPVEGVWRKGAEFRLALDVQAADDHSEDLRTEQLRSAWSSRVFAMPWRGYRGRLACGGNCLKIGRRKGRIGGADEVSAGMTAGVAEPALRSI